MMKKLRFCSHFVKSSNGMQLSLKVTGPGSDRLNVNIEETLASARIEHR